MVTQSTYKAVYKAVQGDTIPEEYLKAMFWILSGATINTHLLEITEKDASGHVVYADAAPKTNGALPIPCPHRAVNGFYIKDLDNGHILAYPTDLPRV